MNVNYAQLFDMSIRTNRGDKGLRSSTLAMAMQIGVHYEATYNLKGI